MPINLFPILIGRLIHHCGALELLTNNAIRGLARDSILSEEITRLRFDRRIKILRELLQKRTGLQFNEVDLLCDELSQIAKGRNEIAHNPIVSDDEQGMNSSILVVRNEKRITEADLDQLVKLAGKILEKFARLVPEYTKG